MDPITCLASLEVEIEPVVEIIQLMVSLYELWRELENPGGGSGKGKGIFGKVGMGIDPSAQGEGRVVEVLRRMREQREREKEAGRA
jgi:hypothetical protein